MLVLVHGKSAPERMARVLAFQSQLCQSIRMLLYGRLKALAGHELLLLAKYRLR